MQEGTGQEDWMLLCQHFPLNNYALAANREYVTDFFLSLYKTPGEILQFWGE